MGITGRGLCGGLEEVVREECLPLGEVEGCDGRQRVFSLMPFLVPSNSTAKPARQTNELGWRSRNVSASAPDPRGFVQKEIPVT